jgi:hypothetical protein
MINAELLRDLQNEGASSTKAFQARRPPRNGSGSAKKLSRNICQRHCTRRRF